MIVFPLLAAFFAVTSASKWGGFLEPLPGTKLGGEMDLENGNPEARGQIDLGDDGPQLEGSLEDGELYGNTKGVWGIPDGSHSLLLNDPPRFRRSPDLGGEMNLEDERDEGLPDVDIGPEFDSSPVDELPRRRRSPDSGSSSSSEELRSLPSLGNVPQPPVLGVERVKREVDEEPAVEENEENEEPQPDSEPQPPRRHGKGPGGRKGRPEGHEHGPGKCHCKHRGKPGGKGKHGPPTDVGVAAVPELPESELPLVMKKRALDLEGVQGQVDAVTEKVKGKGKGNGKSKEGKSKGKKGKGKGKGKNADDAE